MLRPANCRKELHDDLRRLRLARTRLARHEEALVPVIHSAARGSLVHHATVGRVCGCVDVRWERRHVDFLRAKETLRARDGRGGICFAAERMHVRRQRSTDLSVVFFEHLPSVQPSTPAVRVESQQNRTHARVDRIIEVAQGLLEMKHG